MNGLRLRFVLLLSGLCALIAAVSCGLLLHGVRSARDRQWSVELARTLDEFEQVDGNRRAQRLRSMRGMIDYLRQDNPELMQGLLERPERETARLSLLARAFGFDRLDILDDSGRVIASTDSIRLGRVDPPADASATVGLELDGASSPRFVTRAPLQLGARRFSLLGSSAWNDESLARLLPAATRGRFTLDGKSWGGGDASWPDDPARWLSTFRFLGDEPGPDALRVELALDRAQNDGSFAALVWLAAAVVLAAAGVGAVAGFYLARSALLPVARLTRAVDAIAAGKADYSFSVVAGDAFDELAASFSRLQRRLEAQRERSIAAERVAAWRDVAQRVAHEVKNPLAPIRLTVQNLLRVRGRAPERFDELFDEGMRTILEEVEQLSRMVSEFSEFARLPLPDPQPVDLAELIDGVLELYAAEPHLVLERDYALGVAPLTLDADQMTRALKNICGNAVEAMRESSRSAKELRLSVALSVEDGELLLSVEDNGPGLSEEARRRLFEPYFTTREQGTGLGMAMTYRIIVEHGGSIEASNRPEGGARILVTLPLDAETRNS